jgi:hypothetical protein
MFRIWTEEEDGVICAEYSKLSRTKLALLLDRTPSAVANRVHVLGLKKGVQRKHTFNNDFFSVPNPICSYWAGFIAADGTIRDKQKHVVISLTEKDKDSLVAFAENCEYSGTIKTRVSNCKTPSKSYSGYRSVVIEVCGASKWIQDLQFNYNVTPRKTLYLQPPVRLDRLNSLAFICGLIDGDGTIYVGKDGRLQFSVVGTEDMLVWVQKCFDALVPSASKLHAQPRCRNDRGKTHWCYKITGFRANAIMKILMDFDIPRMQRKWINVSRAVEPIYKCAYQKGF